MSWDSKPARRRGQSLAIQSSEAPPPSATHYDYHNILSGQAMSAHVADPFLRDFLAPSFDAAQYLNDALPPLQPSSFSSSSASASAFSSSSPSSSNRPAIVPTRNSKPQVPLADLSAQTQTILSQLGAHTARLTTILTHLTDDILRSGSRLAYEVELLRGEILGLAEALDEGLCDDIKSFLPGGIREAAEQQQQRQQQQQPTGRPKPPAVGLSTTMGGVSVEGDGETSHMHDDAGKAGTTSAAVTGSAETAEAAFTAGPTDPTFIAQLRTLTLVRARLEQVIKIFGDAMNFIFPPSEVSLSSGFLSVSAPDMSSSVSSPGGRQSSSLSSSTAEAAGYGGGGGGVQTTQARHQQQHGSTEEKGKAVLAQLRDEVSALLYPDERDADPVRGVEDAARRVAELKELVRVWRGTAEEKGRARFVNGLARMVEDRHRDLLREIETAQQKEQQQQMQMQQRAGSRQPPGAEPGPKKSTAGGEGENSPSESGGGYGAAFLYSQLQKKLRSGL